LFFFGTAITNIKGACAHYQWLSWEHGN